MSSGLLIGFSAERGKLKLEEECCAATGKTIVTKNRVSKNSIKCEA